jgi:hypothetical protein
VFLRTLWPANDQSCSWNDFEHFSCVNNVNELRGTEIFTVTCELSQLKVKNAYFWHSPIVSVCGRTE